MKGKDIINHIVRKDMPDREQVMQYCHREISLRQSRKRVLFVRPRFAVAAVAVLTVCIMLFTLFVPRGGNAVNMFAIRVYAIERQSDSSVLLHEVNFLESSHVWDGFIDGVNFVLNARLFVEGTNVQSVEFVVQDGLIGVYSDIIGNSIILSNGSTSVDASELFLGVSLDSDVPLPTSIELQVTVTFIDGTSQKETLTFAINFDDILSFDIDSLESLQPFAVGEPIDLMNDPEIYALIQEGASREEILSVLRKRFDITETPSNWNIFSDLDE